MPVFEIVLARSIILMALTLPQLAHKRINPLRCERQVPLPALPYRCCVAAQSTSRRPHPATSLAALLPCRELLLLLRGLLGFGAVSTYYWAVQYLALADVAVLMFLAPVFVAGAGSKRHAARMRAIGSCMPGPQ